MKETNFTINPININNITIYDEYEEMYQKIDFSYKYILLNGNQKNPKLTLDELLNFMQDGKNKGIISNYSGEAKSYDIRSSYIIYYNSFITIKYNGCCEKNIYFTKYNEALEYFNKLNEKLGFINFLNL